MELPYLLIPVEMKYDAEYRNRRFVPTCAQSAGWNVLRYNVCHSSAFQKISVRSVYIIIIIYKCSLLANLNDTMQTKQHAMKKPNPNKM